MKSDPNIMNRMMASKEMQVRSEEFKPPQSGEIGMSPRDLGRYFLSGGIWQLAHREKLDGIVLEASRAYEDVAGREANGFFVPPDVQKRALNVTTASQGGYLVSTDTLGESMIGFRHNRISVVRLGATLLDDLSGNVLIPKVAGAVAQNWLTETATVPADSTLTLESLRLTPHRLVVDVAFSRELFFQSSLSIENFLRRTIMAAVAAEEDRVSIGGSGVSGEPIGIINTTGVNSLTFGGAAVWQDAVDFEKLVANDNAELGSMGYLSSPNAREKWKVKEKVSNTAQFLWVGNEVNGLRAEATKNVPSDRMIFGNWEDLVLGHWAGMDIVVDPYSLKRTGQIEITVFVLLDVGLKHAVSFAISTDSAAQ